MSPAKSAAGTAVIVAGAMVAAWAMERWPNGTLGTLGALTIYAKLREVKEVPRERSGS